MKHITQSSRLVYIYLLTVLVSGVILTVLSISNSSNFKELTEKRILEEEKQLHDLYSQTFQLKLNELSRRIVIEVPKDSLNPTSLMIADSLIIDYIVMDIDGVLLRPRQALLDKKEPESSAFSNNFFRGQQEEFSKQNYAQARKFYTRSLSYARNKADSVKVLNVIARTHYSGGNFAKSSEIYHSLLTNYASSSNSFGMPYANFAMNQLLQMGDQIPAKDLTNFQMVFINGLLLNKIPFSASTQDLLQKLNRNAQNSSLDSLIDLAERRIDLAQNYALHLKNVASLKNQEWSNLGEISVYNPRIEPELLFMTYESSQIVYGVFTSLEKLHRSAMHSLLLPSTRFSYHIEMANPESESFKKLSEDSYQSKFSNHFNEAYLQIWPKDSKKIADYVFRRKLTNIIGLILLLFAMGIGLVTLVQDVNRKRKMEQLRADFVSNVTHELKTPLTSINMFADSILLNRVTKEKEIKKYAHVIVKESERLKRMVNNILDFSRKENDKLKYHLKDSNLGEIVHEIMLEMNYWLEIHNFEVHLDIEDDINVLVDPEGIKQVLSNLITNAIKYSGTEKKIEIRLYRKTNKAYLEVEDHGIGIPEDRLNHIFEKFYRVNSKKNENISGTGLGLTVSRDIIEAQNGKLLVISTLNKGSKFTILLTI